MVRSAWLIAGGAAVAIAIVVVLLFSDSGDEPDRVAVEGVEVSPRAAGVSSGDPDVFFLKTSQVSFQPGLTMVEVGTCPAGNRASGYAGPPSTNGNPASRGRFTYSDDQRSLIVPVENSADEPVTGRLVLLCEPN